FNPRYRQGVESLIAQAPGAAPVPVAGPTPVNPAHSSVWVPWIAGKVLGVKIKKVPEQILSRVFSRLFPNILKSQPSTQARQDQGLKGTQGLFPVSSLKLWGTRH